jgi:hypothetical protein
MSKLTDLPVHLPKPRSIIGGSSDIKAMTGRISGKSQRKLSGCVGIEGFAEGARTLICRLGKLTRGASYEIGQGGSHSSQILK